MSIVTICACTTVIIAKVIKIMHINSSIVITVAHK